MKKTTNTGFTLVELIIVITILAILATIAFISFQGYTRDSRNAKRESDLNTIVRTVEVKAANGVSMVDFITADTNSFVETGSTYSIAGTGYVAGTYEAGTLDFTVLGANATSFKDPLDGSYVMAATTLAGGKYQVAASKEDESSRVALVKGTYAKRGTGTVTVSNNTNDGSYTTVTISDNLGLLQKGDTVSLSGSTATIKSISSDLSRVTLNSVVSGTASFQLKAVEIAGLVGEKGTATGVVSDKGSVLPY